MASNYKIEGQDSEIVCQSLTFGYLDDIESGLIAENIIDAVVDGTDLESDDVRKLRRPDVMAIWELIKKETYPELYNEDGTPKDFENDDVGDDKKKV